jgi:hypothetical protein
MRIALGSIFQESNSFVPFRTGTQGLGSAARSE